MVDTEDRKDRFKRLAEKRVNKVIKEIRLIGNLSRKSAYKYTNEDIEKMKKAIHAELKETWSRFNTGPESGEEKSFKL